jgi:NAD-dependent deacetylase
VLIVTQNVDDLHEKGGARNVIHMHGTLTQDLCNNCGWRGPALDALDPDTPCPSCTSKGQLRPDVVWFGEIPYRMDEIEEALVACDLFVSIGTSGSVYPAAGYVRLAREVGAHTLELNLEPSDGDYLFRECRYGPATQIVPAWVDEVLAGK